MGGEQSVVAARFPTLGLGDLVVKEFLVFQYTDDLDHGLRVVAGTGEIFGAETIRFQLMFATITGEQRAAQGIDQQVAG